MFLSGPAVIYKESYLQAVRESQQMDRRDLAIDVATLERDEDFAMFARYYQNMTNPANCPPGQVPTIYYWLVDGDEYIGRLAVRLSLNEYLSNYMGHIGYDIRPSKRRQGYGKEILRLGLPKAKAYSLDRVLVTCDVDNIGSRKIIESNGGQLENIVDKPGHRVKVLRYWITIP